MTSFGSSHEIGVGISQINHSLRPETGESGRDEQWHRPALPDNCGCRIAHCLAPRRLSRGGASGTRPDRKHRGSRQERFHWVSAQSVLPGTSRQSLQDRLGFQLESAQPVEEGCMDLCCDLIRTSQKRAVCR